MERPISRWRNGIQTRIKLNGGWHRAKRTRGTRRRRRRKFYFRRRRRPILGGQEKLGKRGSCQGALGTEIRRLAQIVP